VYTQAFSPPNKKDVAGGAGKMHSKQRIRNRKLEKKTKNKSLKKRRQRQKSGKG